MEALDVVIKALQKNKSNAKTTAQLILLRDRLLKLCTPKVQGKPGIGVERAITAMRDVLGDKLAVPRNPSDQWRIMQSMRIKSLGLTEDDCKAIARCIAVKWDAPYSFEYCIRAADRLLTESSIVVKKTKTKENAPVEMDEW